ncbi:MAG: thioredoxin domain-containing protein, partial [Candidatus Sulfotelmatobacter sp.]
HHNPAKNVLYVRASIDEIARRMGLKAERVEELLESAKKKMYAARLQRPTPYVDKTVYVAWNSMCVSAYLEAGKVLGFEDARRFGLKSLDRILAEAWKSQTGALLHVVAYSDPKAEHREIPGLLDDYAATAIACLDAYEATASFSYFKFARAIGDSMIARFFDPLAGGFFDAEPSSDGNSFGVLSTRRKPLQDSPTPAGNSMAAIALLRLHHLTDNGQYRDKAEQTLEAFAGVAGQLGIFAATYGTAVLHFLNSPLQIVVIAAEESESQARQLTAVANSAFGVNKSALRLPASQVVPANLPPALAATLPNLPLLHSGKSFAVLCSGSTCQPPIVSPIELREALESALKRSA